MGRRQLRPRRQGALPQGPRGVAHQDGGVRPFLRAQSLASGAPAEYAVERKMMRSQWVEAATTLLTYKMLAVTIDLPLRFLACVIDMRDVHDPPSQIECHLDRLRKSAPLALSHDQAVDHDFDRMLAAMVDARRLADLERFAIDAHAHKPAAAN